MAINTQIPREEWSDFFVRYSNGNRGRSLTLEVFDRESGDSGQARQGKLLGIDYDPPGKGNNIVVSTGVEEIDYAHTIQTPVKVWRTQQDSGEDQALEIVDDQGVRTVLGLGSR
jgi:hypothetical protein